MTAIVAKYSTRIRDKLPQHLDKVDKKAQKTDRSLKKVAKTSNTIGTTTRTKTITKDIRSMGEAAEKSRPKIKGTTLALGGLFVGYIGLMHAIRRADAWTNMSNKLRLITKDMDDLKATQAGLVDLAVETRSDLDALVTTYQRVDKALVRMGSSSEDTKKVVKALALGIKTTGIASDEATNALRQITQAFNKGKLDGDEFRSVGENMPVVLDAIAKEAGISRGELMKWARQGKITSELMQQGLLKALPQLEKDFKKIRPTVADSTKGMSAKWTELVGTIANSKDAFGWLIKFFEDLADAIDLATKSINQLNKKTLIKKNANDALKASQLFEEARKLREKGDAKSIELANQKQKEAETLWTKHDEVDFSRKATTKLGASGRGRTDIAQLTPGEQILGSLEADVNALMAARGDISPELFQQRAKGLLGRAEGLPLDQKFSKAFNLEKDIVAPETATKEQKAQVAKINQEDLRAYKETREGLKGVKDALKAVIEPAKESSKAVKESSKKLTEREMFEKNTIQAMNDVNKEMVVINTQRKLGIIDDQQAAEALVTLGHKKKQIKAEYLAEIATNDKLKPSLSKLNEEFDKLGKKVDPAVQGAKEKIAKQTVIDTYEKQLQEQRDEDERKKKAISDARKGAAIGLGKQAATGIISEVGAGFMGESLGIDPTTGKPREAKAGGGTAVDSLNAGVEKFIETGDPLQALFAALAPILRDVMKALSGLIPLFSKGLGKVFKALNKLIPILANALAPILEGISPLLDVVAVIFDAIGNVLQQTLVPSMEILGPILKVVSKLIKTMMDLLIRWWNFLIYVIATVTFGTVKFDKFKTSDQLESATAVTPEAETADETKNTLEKQLEEQKRQREIAEKQLAEQKKQREAAEAILQAQLEAERASHELELELRRQASRSAVRATDSVRFSDLPNRAQGGAPSIRIINVNDPEAVDAQLHTDTNEQAVMNFLRVNAPEVNEYVVQ